MKDKKLEERIQHSLNAELSGLRTTSYQRDQFFENATGGYKVKKKISVAAILVAALMLITVTALAVALLSGKQAVKEVLVPIATQSEEEVSCHVLPKQPCKCPYFGTRLKNQRRKGL